MAELSGNRRRREMGERRRSPDSRRQGGSPEGVVRSNDLFAPFAARQVIRALLNSTVRAALVERTFIFIIIL